MTSAGGGEIVLHRTKAFQDRFRKYKVVVDGKPIGHVKAGEVKTFAIAPGDHELELKIDWMGSPVIGLSMSPGDRLHFACGGSTGSNSFFDLFGPADRWVYLEPMNPQP